MAAKKKQGSPTPAEQVLADMTAAPKGPQLNADAFFGDSQGGIWVHSNYGASGYTYRMPNTSEVLLVEQGDVVAGWGSSSGATYLVTSANHPLLRFFDGNFALIPLQTPIASAVIVGRAGAAPDADRLALLTRASHVVYEDRPTELWCGPPHDLQLTRLGIVGEPVGLAFGDGEELWVGISAHYGGEPSLLRVCAGSVEQIPLPKAAGASCDVNGLARTADGQLLLMLGDRRKSKQPAQPWLRARDGRWRQVSAPSRLYGWLDNFALIDCGAKVYVPTLHGVWSFDGKRFVSESTLHTSSLWRCGDTLVARGYVRGQHAYEILRDGKWQPFAVPEPDVVPGGLGKQVYLDGKNVLPVRRVRLPAPPPRRRPAPAPAAKVAARTFSFNRFLRTLTEHPAAKKRDEPLDLVSRVKADRGLPLAADVRAYLTALGSHAFEHSVGQWLHPDPNDVLFLDTSSLDRFVEGGLKYPGNAAGLLMDLLPIGCDVSGNCYCVELAKDRSRVFILPHELDELSLVADSLTTFAELNDLEQAWLELADAEGMDWDDHDRDTPAFKALQTRAKALEGRVNAVFDYVATLEMLLGKKPRLRGASTTVVGAKWRLGLVTELSIDRASRDTLQRGLRAERSKLPKASAPPSAFIYRLLCHALLGNEVVVEQLLEGAAKQPSNAVRRACELVTVARRAKPSKAGRWFKALVV